MTKENIYAILKITWVILLLFTLASSFLFTKGGIVTRKTLKVTYLGCLFLFISGLLILWFSSESPPYSKIVNLLCVIGVFFLFSVYWAFRYYVIVPKIEEMIEKRDNKKD